VSCSTAKRTLAALQASLRKNPGPAIDLNDDALAATRKRLPGGCLTLTCDVTNSSEVAATVTRVCDTFGNIDILINNAGIGAAPNDGSERFQERLGRRATELATRGKSDTYADHTVFMEDSGWHAVMDVNINGTFYFCREVLKTLCDGNHRGSIVNISSTSALNGEGGAHYCASKAAIIGLTKALAQELGPRGIRVNAVAPGPTNTPAMASISEEWQRQIAQTVLLGRLAQPEEIARAVAFLASDDSSYLTGHTLCANGGMYLI